MKNHGRDEYKHSIKDDWLHFVLIVLWFAGDYSYVDLSVKFEVLICALIL